MARAVLILAALLAGPAAAQSELCSAAGEPFDELAADATRTPAYAFLAARSGPPQSCQGTDDDGTLTATIAFPDGSELLTTAIPALEASSYEVRLAPGAAPDAAGIAALLAGQQAWLAPPDGCMLPLEGLAEAARETADTSETEGEVCSCRATITRQNGAITGFRLGMAC